MGFLDKLRGKKDAPAEARAPAANDELSTWLASVMARLQPEKIQFQPGENLGQVFARVFDEEEKAVRAGGGDPVVQQLKLDGLARLRQQFPVDDSPQTAGGQAMAEAGRPAEATYEVVLGTQEEVKDVPLAMLMQLIHAWGTAVGLVGEKLRLPDALRAEYRKAGISVEPGQAGDELVVTFRGAKEMVEIYRGRLKALGIDQG